jgi:sugar phosphate isomerase/epimerase
MRKFLMCALMPIFAFSGCQRSEDGSLPEIRLGFTTQNFIPAIPVSLESTKEFLRYAQANEFSWIELRDPDASLTIEECREIAALARELGVEVNYSAQRALLAADFWEVFGRAVVNTAVFDGPRTVRILALRGAGDKGWSEQELNHMVETANQALQRAAEHGVGFSIENADAVLNGQGQPYHGMTELLQAIDPAVALQLDTANLFTGPDPVSPEEAEAFIRRFAARVSYLHLKSAREGVALPILDGNPLPFEQIFSLLATTGKPIYAAIELASGNAPVEEIYQNIKTSRHWLNDK